MACYELGHQPLSVAWPAAVLEARGFRPAVLDLSVEAFDPERVARARLAALAVPMHTALRIGVAAAERIREANPGCHRCFYGLYAALNAEHLLAGVADSVVAGEVEEPLASLALALESGVDLDGIPGVTRRGRPGTPHLRRQALPVPSRSALPGLDRYVRLRRDGQLLITGYAESSRGCRHLCRHCPIPPVYGGRFVAVPVETVLADVRQQVLGGARHVTFGDPDFLNGPTHALRVARALHAEFPGVTFDFTAKVEHLLRHRRLLPELVGLGGLFAVTAVESLSDTVLAHLDKGHTRAQVFEVLEVARSAGLVLRPTWVAFTPWTRLDDYREMLDAVEARDLIQHVDPVQYGLRLLVPPGSLLAGHPAMAPYLGPLVPEDFAHPWRHPDPRMDRLQGEVSALVAEAAPRDEDPVAIFARVRALADQAAGAPPRPVRPPVAAPRERPPHLSEPWFC